MNDQEAEQEPRTWRYATRDFLIVGVLSAISAVAYAGLGQLWAVLTAATGPVGGTLIGLFQFGHILGGAIIRKPGSVLAISVLSTVIQAFLGDPAGFYVIGWGITHGIGAEIVFLLTGAYRNATMWKLVLAAGVGAVCGHFFSYALYGWDAALYLFFLSIPLLFVSSGVQSGILAYVVLRGVKRAHVA